MENIFVISQLKHMLWVLKRTVSSRHMFKLMDKKIITILLKLFLLNWPNVSFLFFLLIMLQIKWASMPENLSTGLATNQGADQHVHL